MKQICALETRKQDSPNSLRRGSLGSVMESQRAARSMLASFLTFQFLCNNRSSQGNFFASFNNFSSSDILSASSQPIFLSTEMNQKRFKKEMSSEREMEALSFVLLSLPSRGRGRESTNEGGINEKNTK